MNHKKTKSLSALSKYGPTLPKQPKIANIIGYRINKKTSGLKKKSKNVPHDRQKRQQSNAYLAMQVGELNLVKRFKRIEYLDSWASRKPIFNICEERTVSRLICKSQMMQGCRSVM